MPRRLALLLILVLVAGCAATATSGHAPVTSLQQIAGHWHGWLITPRDYVAATLTIADNGSFELLTPRTRVAGTVTATADGLRFAATSGIGAGGWHGKFALYEGDGGRLLKISRDDRLFPGRFTPASTG
jgi:hypothetical protein